MANLDVSFCHACGDYLEPSKAEVCWIAEGQPRTVCPECRRTIYRERIEKAVEGMNKRQQQRRKQTLFD